MSDLETLHALLRTDFGTFLHKSFKTIHPATPFMPNWHLEAIAHELDQVASGANTRVIINQPPRSLKSITISVAFVAWCLGRNPAQQIVVVSYSREFAADLHRQFRVLVESTWYPAVFPNVRWAKQTDTDFVTTLGGGRFATSIGGQLTGRGGDLIVVDDPMNAQDAQSEPARKRVIDFFSSSLVTRLNDKRRQGIIVVMQRLHQDDLAGHLLDKRDGWRLLSLPAIATEDADIPLGNGRIYHRKQGEVLHAEREDRATLDRLKGEMGSFTFSAQYQQQPLPLDGNLVRIEWLKFYEALPERKSTNKLVLSWDIATTENANSDYSVCTIWMCTKDDAYLLHVWRGKLEFPELRKKIAELARQYKATHVLIEEAGAGQMMLQDLQASVPQAMPRPIGIKPQGSKTDRLAMQAARFESGAVHLPKDAPWLADYVTELLGFPGTRHDDQVDSTSQFLGWWMTHKGPGFVMPYGDFIIRPDWRYYTALEGY